MLDIGESCRIEIVDASGTRCLRLQEMTVVGKSETVKILDCFVRYDFSSAAEDAEVEEEDE